VVVTNTFCEENIGRATIEMIGEMDMKEFEWQIVGGIESGIEVYGSPSGTYTVTGVSMKNCKTPKTFQIMSDVLVFNGVSRNNDGLNDVFEIACINEYPNNIVKIFNRAGTLVYEAKGYNNEDIVFDGLSNRGVNIMGNNLPDGTYFYIIDKGDGSQPKTGYLEILR